MALSKEFDQQGNFLFKYRSVLPVLVLGVGLGVYAFVIWEETKARNPSFAANGYEFFCLGVGLLGLLVRILTVGFTPKNTSGRNTHGQLADELNTSGMYSIVRHPLYLGNFFMWLGVAMLTQDGWFITAFSLAYWLYYERIMYAEEQYIAKKFGDDFKKWAAQTPAIVPFPSQWRNPNLCFSVRKVLRQEKNGFAALFLLFFVFDTVGEFITYGDVSFRNEHWLVMGGVSGLIYLVLKLIKNYTDLLNEEGR
ncbi:lipid A Kdo2 1-phosphate O-methyltransferase [Rhabdobacter roseus]|uniref:Protein-S-isoprenylcysteine O-methyltransferase Ste14 n=1 Tax=Rhabdobacter roseus TaxID=1655419 RepID=A0A840TK51_9BACT|nr:isoprenylcysteine carboxylmethyltransferase family protein [Rhabdobacter roseus]MBB5283821.1 protein-S-isoprenylcysteine O-methyltransferase Ste14 [Rhabdobacter roseus]